MLDKPITLRWAVYALAAYAGYVLLQDHFLLSKVVDFLSHVQGA